MEDYYVVAQESNDIDVAGQGTRRERPASGSGRPSCPMREPRSRPEASTALLGRHRMIADLAGDRGTGELDLERPATVTPATRSLFKTWVINRLLGDGRAIRIMKIR